MILHNEDIEILLRESGLKVTGHRLTLVAFLSKQKKPVTVPVIWTGVSKHESIDQATVYRNLVALETSGIIRRYDYNHGHAHYELETGRPSVQVVCRSCESIDKIEGVPVDDTLKKIVRKAKSFSTLKNYSLEIFGTCKKCEA